MTATLTLKTKTYATGIHGVSGRAVEDGWLEAGTLVRNVRATGAVHPLDGMPWYQFDASTDGGKTWFVQEVCGEPRVA
jgi:hypothetical protein